MLSGLAELSLFPRLLPALIRSQVYVVLGDVFVWRKKWQFLLHFFSHKDSTVTPSLKIFRVRTDGVQGNQVHGFIVQSLEVLNLDFQPIPSRSEFYSIATWHPCTFSTKFGLQWNCLKFTFFLIPRVNRVLLCIWFPWTPPVLTLAKVKTRGDAPAQRRGTRARHHHSL